MQTAIYKASGPQILVLVVLAAVRYVRSHWLHLRMDLVLIQALRKFPSKDQLHRACYGRWSKSYFVIMVELSLILRLFQDTSYFTPNVPGLILQHCLTAHDSKAI